MLLGVKYIFRRVHITKVNWSVFDDITGQYFMILYNT